LLEVRLAGVGEGVGMVKVWPPLSAISYQLSAIGYRLSAISYQLSASDPEFQTTDFSPSMMVPVLNDGERGDGGIRGGES
jgi:hypothetical protein